MALHGKPSCTLFCLQCSSRRLGWSEGRKEGGKEGRRNRKVYVKRETGWGRKGESLREREREREQAREREREVERQDTEREMVGGGGAG